MNDFLSRYTRTTEAIIAEIELRQDGGTVNAAESNRPPNNGQREVGAPSRAVSVGLVGSNPTPDTKPCCARIRTVDGHTGWCGLPDDGHVEHQGVTSAELGHDDFGPSKTRKRGW